MLKVISLLKRKESMSLAEFRRWALEEHPPLGKQLPGIDHLLHVVGPNPGPLWSSDNCGNDFLQ